MSLVGNLEDLGLGDIFQIIFLSRRSGILSIRGKQVEGKIFFKDGMVIAAHSTVTPSMNVEFLAQKGLITPEQAVKVSSSLQPGEDIFSSLKKNFQINVDTIKQAVTHTIQNTVFTLFIEEGSFDFELKDMAEEIKGLKPGSLLTLEPGLNPQFLAMEGSRLIDEAKAGIVSPPSQPPQQQPAAPPAPPEVDIPIPETPVPETFAPPEVEIPIPEAPTPETFIPPPVEPVVEHPPKPEVILKKAEPKPQPVEESFSPKSIWAEAGITEEAHIESVVSSPGLTLLRSMIFELQNPHSSSEITLMILRFASELMNRAILFIVKKETIEGLGQFGVTLKQGDPNKKIKGIKILVKDESVFREVITKKVTVKKKGLEPLPVHEYLVKELGGHQPNEVFIAPLLVSGKVAALLYGDNAPEEKSIGDTDSLEIFLAQAGIAMERALLERRLSMMGKE